MRWPEQVVWEEITGGEDELDRRQAPVRRAPTSPGSTSRAPAAAQGRDAVRRRAEPGAPGQAAERGSNLLLLDEPTNDLDVDTLRALEEALLNYAGCAVVISHDRWFLDRIATHMLAFEGDSRVVWFEGNYQDYEADRRRRLGAEADHAASDQVPEADALGEVRKRHR